MVGLDDRAGLRAQYGTPTNLTQRANLYAHQEPQHDLQAIALDLLGVDALRGPILDVGCGPGTYLARFAVAGGRRLFGVDQSPGMAAAATGSHAAVTALVGDASALPFPDDVAAAATAFHMLYHVPDPLVAMEELRRVAIAGAPVVILTNARDHLQTLKELRAEAAGAADDLPWPGEKFGLEHVGLVEQVFGPVELHELRGEITITEPEPLVAYLASAREFYEGSVARPWAEVVERFGEVVDAHLADGPIVVHSHSGFFKVRA